MAYEPHNWSKGEDITAELLNKMEQGIQNEQVGPAGPKGDTGPAGPKGDTGAQGPAGKDAVLTAATKESIGAVKMAEAVSDAAGENVTKEEYNALLASLRAAGILSPT